MDLRTYTRNVFRDAPHSVDKKTLIGSETCPDYFYSLDINVREAFLKLKLKVKSIALVYTVYFAETFRVKSYYVSKTIAKKVTIKNGRIYFSFKCSNMIDVILHLFD